MNKQRFGGVARLHGEDGFAKLQAAHVCVVGIGGVGSWVCEALARTGVGTITLIDADDICVTNINRQIHALTDTIGQEKTAAMAATVSAAKLTTSGVAPFSGFCFVQLHR